MAISKEQIKKDINDINDIYDKCRAEQKKKRGVNVSSMVLKEAMLTYISLMEYGGEDVVRLNRLRDRIK